MNNDSYNDKIKIELKLCKTKKLFLINCLFLQFVGYIFFTPQTNNNNCTL